MIHEQYYAMLKKQEKLLSRKNKINKEFYNGIYDRYVNPILTRDSVPLTWKYDICKETNPFFMERLGINCVFNSGAIYLNGKYCLVCRVEGNDRKSFFAVAESPNGIDNFRFQFPFFFVPLCQNPKIYEKNCKYCTHGLCPHPTGPGNHPTRFEEHHHVGNHDQGLMLFPDNPLHQFHHFSRCFGIQISRRLICQYDGRFCS